MRIGFMKTMYVYILECADESYYIGVTKDLEFRLRQHKEGVFKTCYTFNKRPLELVFYEMFNSPMKAIEFEKKLKGWTRAKKKALIEKRWNDLKSLAECKNESHFERSLITLRLRSG